jgi:hypothetical protein
MAGGSMPTPLTAAQADTVATLNVLQIWDPDNFQAILDKRPQAGQTIAQLASDAGAVAKLFLICLR